jgi:dihydrofolate reductase
MGIVKFNMSVSLDGFVAGLNDSSDNPLGDGGAGLFEWYNSGDTEYKAPGGEWAFHISAASAKHLAEEIETSGVLITARTTFDIANAWGGEHPMKTPVVVLTHHVPEEWVYDGSPFTFVTEGGIEAAVAKAKQIAGDKDVVIGTATTMQQALKAGLLDEIHLDLTPLIIGRGVRLFDHLGIEPIELEPLDVIEGTGVTHLRYRIRK